MTRKTSSGPPNEDLILARIDAMEQRIATLEKGLQKWENPRQYSQQEFPENQQDEAIRPREKSGGFESFFGQYGFAWLSIIVLVFCVIFLMNFMSNQDKPGLAILVGYLSCAGIYLVSVFLKSAFLHQVKLLRITAHLLFFYITLQIHFFTTNPFLENGTFAWLLLLIPLVFLYVQALRTRSQAWTVIATLLAVFTALLADETHITLPIFLIISALSLYLLLKNNWKSLFYLSLFAIYLGHLIWLMNNPILGHAFEPVEQHQFNLIYLFGYGILFALVAMFNQKKSISPAFITAASLWNAGLFALILLFEVSIFFEENYLILFAPICLFTLVFSIILQLRASKAFITAFYACVSFVALSITIYGLTGFPDVYFWLALQSLLVLSIALWYRIQLIVIVNALLFVGMLIFYLIKSGPIDDINIVFAAAALVTARFINWKKERLRLQSEGLRNAYLLIGFGMVLYTLYHILPAAYITLSWVIAALLYFGLSFILKNVKYRWMAIGTILAAIVHLFFADLSNMEMGVRVIAFLGLAILTLVTSLYYSKRAHKRNETE